MNENDNNLRLVSEQYALNPAEMPQDILVMAKESNLLAIDPVHLFFRETKPAFSVPDLQPWNFFGARRLDYSIYYLLNDAGSLLVFAHLTHAITIKFAAQTKSYDCLYLGCIRRQDWLFAPTTKK